MNKFEKGRGLAVASGILFILYAIIVGLNTIGVYIEFDNYSVYVPGYNYDYLNFIFYRNMILVFRSIYVIALIILGIMLICKIYSGLIIPVIVLIIQYVCNLILDIFMHIYLRGIGTGIISHIIGYAVLMLPWIIMLIVFRLCKKNRDNNSALNVLCFIPAIITLATSILSGFELRGLEAGLGVISHTVVQIIFCAILLTANILCGIWIFKNTYKEKIPNNQHGQYNQTQPYYPQQYNPRLQYGQSQFVQHQYNQPQNVQPQNNEPVYQPQEESKTNMNTESEVEKIKAYKELLDSGAITQEEYDFKKKQLLGMQKASKGSNMNGYNKGRGLAVTSGILFIIYAAVSNLYFFRNIEAYFDYKTTDAVINVALRIVPLFILGIMMFIGKMHVGLLIPPLLISSQYISYIIMDIDAGYSRSELYFFYVLRMIPWIIMFIILILFIKNKKKANYSSIGFLGLLPGITFAIASGITRFGFDFYNYYGVSYNFRNNYGLSNFLLYVLGNDYAKIHYSGILTYIAENIILLAALLLMGFWILKNTNGQNAASYQQYGQIHQPGMGQSVYTQSQPYYPQQPAQGYQQPYVPQYNQQPVNYQQGMAQPYGQPQYNQQYQQPPYNQQQYTVQQPMDNQQEYQLSAEPQPVFGEANDIADTLKTYKELLDNGIITQEEFDAKKKQILGL